MSSFKNKRIWRISKNKYKEGPKSTKSKKFKYIITYIMDFENESKSESCSQLDES